MNVIVCENDDKYFYSQLRDISIYHISFISYFTALKSEPDLPKLSHHKQIKFQILALLLLLSSEYGLCTFYQLMSNSLWKTTLLEMFTVDLPSEVLKKIFDLLSPSQIPGVALVCRYRNIVQLVVLKNNSLLFGV